MSVLTFKVNGQLHKGTINIALNGADYYEVYLQSGKETTLINGECALSNWAILSTNTSREEQIGKSITVSANSNSKS